MVQIVESNSLLEYEFTPEEQHEADKLGTYTVLKLKTLRTQLIKQRTDLKIDPNQMMSYLQAEAELGGRLQLIDELLADDEIARAATAPRNAN